MTSTVVTVCGNPDANLNVLLVNNYRKPQEITQGCVEVFGRDGLELRPLMDLWIMGLLYKLIVRGSRLHGAFAEKGLVRSVYPTGRMHGRSPVLSLSVWRTVCLDGGDKQEVVWETGQKCEGRGRMNTNPGGISAAPLGKPRNQREQRTFSRSLMKTAQAETSAEFTAWE